MRLLLWILTIVFALAGLALRADSLLWPGAYESFVGHQVANGLFVLAFLSCPFLWARAYDFLPGPLVIPGKSRLMMALALILAAPLILPWPV